ncbi:MAG: DsbC family protein [Nitrospirae bacterium]|nr:DsbC family protein [Nitrospirota bacterium]MBF0535374.1 DsbC family protein [Nitrospirota bacterium]MBF0616894.1 DsbC family protein [Nitrospirota bacterium]
MLKKLLIFLGVFLALAVYCSAETTEEAFKKVFPNVKYDTIKESPVKGLYEILVGSEIIYFDPATGILILGEMRMNNGKNLTSESLMAVMKERVKNIPYEKGMKIGNGKNIVVEFTDPDCPYCRRAAAFLKTKKDITRYVFLYPLVQLHPDSEKKARFILCAKDKVKAFYDVLDGKYDDKEITVCNDDKVEATLKEYRNVGDKIGVSGSGTPFLIVNGEPVQGANLPLINKYLGEPEEQVPGHNHSKLDTEKTPDKHEDEKAPAKQDSEK